MGSTGFAQSIAEQGPSYDRAAYHKAFVQILNDLQNEDFDALERRYREYLAAGARSSDGRWMLQSFRLALDSISEAEPPGRIERRLRNWKGHAPGSALRPVAEAIVWLHRAWQIKGTDCYPQIPSSARKAFNGLIDRSASALREDEARGKNSALWYGAAILVAGGQGRPAADLDALLAEADRRFPGYEPLYAARMEFLLPEWGGGYEAVDRFVQASARQTAALEGNAFYTLLYMELTAGPPCAQHFERSKVSWPQMKAGFEDILRRHPDVSNENAYATFACRMRDVETTRRLLDRLGAAADLGGRFGSITNDSCKRMVQGAAAAPNLGVVQQSPSR